MCDQTEYSPLRERHGVIYEAGWLTHAWAPHQGSMRTVDGRVCFALRQNDRGVAKVFDLPGCQRTPYEHVTVLDWLRQLRNAATDKLLADIHAEDDDPLAHAAVGEHTGKAHYLATPCLEVCQR